MAFNAIIKLTFLQRSVGNNLYLGVRKGPKIVEEKGNSDNGESGNDNYDGGSSNNDNELKLFVF